MRSGASGICAWLAGDEFGSLGVSCLKNFLNKWSVTTVFCVTYVCKRYSIIVFLHKELIDRSISSSSIFVHGMSVLNLQEFC